MAPAMTAANLANFARRMAAVGLNRQILVIFTMNLKFQKPPQKFGGSLGLYNNYMDTNINRESVIEFYVNSILDPNDCTEQSIDEGTDMGDNMAEISFSEGDMLLELSIQFDAGQVDEATVRSRVREILATCPVC
jgi:hypothetical protein